MRVLAGIGLAIAVIVAVAVLFALPAGWMFMLLVGGLHSEFGWFRNTIAFWPAVGIMLAGGVVVKSLFGVKSETS